ncbi:MAG TPA: YqgE/AlgH family protein [Bryobacteraceae bacterium]|nr:YqgE/AlgH family protein [Bryobacteraceae bacterium]
MAPGPSAVSNRTSWLGLGAALALLLAGTELSPSHSTKAFRRTSEVPRIAFLPAQSKNAKELGPSTLLVASRDLADPNFAQTVVLLIHDDAEGVLGLILNRRTEVPLSRAVEGLSAAKGRADPVYLGGPVEISAVFALLNSRVKVNGAENVFGSVYLILSKISLERTISAQPDASNFHVYLGYAGWTHDQLKREVELGAWFIFPADAGTVFDANPDTLWLRMIRKTEQRFAGISPPVTSHLIAKRISLK